MPDGAIPPDEHPRRLADRAPHLHPGLLALVLLGGALGTLARYGAEQLVPRAGDLPWPTLTVNLVGAFALGLLLESLVWRARHHSREPRGLLAVRLGLGTGFLGAFTSYSTLAEEAGLLIDDARVGEAIAYGVVSVVAGMAAAALGVWIASRRRTEDGAGS